MFPAGQVDDGLQPNPYTRHSPYVEPWFVDHNIRNIGDAIAWFGHNLPVLGREDALTGAALTAWQQFFRLLGDEEEWAGGTPATWRADIRAVQRRLFTSPPDRPGYLDLATQRAVKGLMQARADGPFQRVSFLSDIGLFPPDTGIDLRHRGPNTWALVGTAIVGAAAGWLLARR